jgi:hypothetical protein
MDIKTYFIIHVLMLKLLLCIRIFEYRVQYDKESINVLNYKAKTANNKFYNMENLSFLKFVKYEYYLHYGQLCSSWRNYQWTDSEQQLPEALLETISSILDPNFDDFSTNESGILSIGSMFAFYGNISYLKYIFIINCFIIDC